MKVSLDPSLTTSLKLSDLKFLLSIRKLNSGLLRINTRTESSVNVILSVLIPVLSEIITSFSDCASERYGNDSKTAENSIKITDLEKIIFLLFSNN